MSDEQKNVENTNATEEVVAAPEVPASEPPVEEKPEEKAAEETPAAEGGDAPETEKKEKKSSGVTRRFTFTKRWGKHRDEPAAPKEPEAAIDPKADIVGWIGQQIPAAVHKANFQVLDWIQKVAVENEADRKPIPGKDQSTTRNQFLSFLRDGDLLVKLANSLQAGAVEPVALEENADAAAQKEAQKKNIENFSTWANNTIGNENGMKGEDLLEKGKAGYSAVFQTLWQLGLQAKEKFDKEGFDVEGIMAIANQVVKSGLLTTILGFFRRNRQASVEEQPKEEEEGQKAEEKAEGEEKADAAADAVDEPVATKIETSAPAAVAAN